MSSSPQVFARYEAGEISPEIALMELLIATEDADQVGAFVQALAGSSPRASSLAQVFAAHEQGCRRIAAMLQADVDRPPVGASVEDGIRFCQKLFDWSVQQSEPASVALYSLGSAQLLAAATGEIRDLLQAWNLLEARSVALDIGCGTGRIEEALAPALAHIHGIDVSTEMVRAAERRCGGLPNVTIWPASGRDLQGFASTSFDLVLAIDSFPYIVQAGFQLACDMFAEAARVLRPAGSLVILNFSYRGDRARDRSDCVLLAERNNFEVLVNGALPFRLWNGDAYHLRKRPSLTKP